MGLEPGTFRSAVIGSNTWAKRTHSSPELHVGLDFDVSEILNKPPLCQNLVWSLEVSFRISSVPTGGRCCPEDLWNNWSSVQLSAGFKTWWWNGDVIAARHGNVLCWMCVYMISCRWKLLWRGNSPDVDRTFAGSRKMAENTTKNLWPFVPHLTWINIVQIMVDSWRANCEELVEMFTFASLHRLPRPCGPEAEGLPLTDFAQTLEDKKKNKINVFL